MDITGKIKLFVEQKTAKDGRVFPVVSTSVGTQKQDKTYSNMTLEVKFDKNNFPEEKLVKLDPTKVYDMNVTEGWLGVREYHDKKTDTDRKVLYVHVKQGELTGSKDRKPRDPANGLPF